MSAVVGIDLGTTNTVVGAVQNGRALALATQVGPRLIPSVVSFHPSGSVMVGHDAKARKLQDAENTIYSTKRLIGRSFDSPEVKEARSRAAFQIQEGPGHGVLVVARGESYTLSEISAFILKEAKRVAEAALGETVERAVVTVPANFNDLQRAATKVAGHIAGIEVLRILNEPTAAALAYGYGKGNQERIVVYDFGGGTFDVTLLDLAGNVFEVLATSGETFLGGDDIDIAIADRIADAYLKTHRYDPRTDRQAFERVASAAETLKIKLSNASSATVHLQDIAYGPGGKAIDMPFTMTRSELDQIAQPFIERTLQVCTQAIHIARLKPSNFDQVIVVGGTTRIPSVRQGVADFFGRKPMDRLSADEVVALGAAIQGSALAGAERRRGGTVVMQSRKKITNPGLGSGQSSSVGMVAAPAPTSPITLPQDPNDDEETTHFNVTSDDYSTLTRDAPSPDVKPLSGKNKPPPPPPMRARMPSRRADIPPPEKRSGTAPGLFPNDPPLPIVEPDRSSPSGLRIADEGPSELLSATVDSTVGRQVSRSTTEPMASASPPPSIPVIQEQPPALPPDSLVANEGDETAASAIVASSFDAQPPPPPAAHRVTNNMGAPTVTAPHLQPKPAPQAAKKTEPHVPLLVDVTPFSLAVETVGGYCDVIIERNTPVPCERTRLFATASDNQTLVRIAVAQGESKKFSENAQLGQLELTGLPAANRGRIQVAVTFEMDPDGILNVRAANTQTGKEAKARMRLEGGVPDGKDINSMRDRLKRLL